MADLLVCRVHGDPTATALIYLPGIHGDWTLVTSFRLAVQRRVRFVEFCYPRTTEWSLGDHAQAIREALDREGIRQGWLLAESFGSQVAWALLETQTASDSFRASGLILAGGFVRYPYPALLTLATGLATRLPDSGLRAFLWLYARYARFRHRSAPETLEAVSEFVQRRLHPDDRGAIVHRLRLIAGSDPRPVAQACPLPTWSLTGFWDPIVPWVPMRRWLRRYCPGWRGDRILTSADHTVLATQPAAAARIILDWIDSEEGRDKVAKKMA
jgi:pimeloyl-ACP methyl ester carboxylesterase